MLRFFFPALLACICLFAQAQEKPKGEIPKPLYAIQLAIEPGKPSKLTIRGRNLDTVTDIRVQEPKSSGKVLGKGRKSAVGNQQSADVVGDSEIDVEVTPSKEAAGGLLALSLIGPGGEGKPCVVAINDDTPRLTEKEPNDSFKQAQPLNSPIIVEGGFKGAQDVDVFSIFGKSGEEYTITVQAKRLGSPAEPLISVYNGDLRVVVSGESTSTNPDQTISFKVSKDGQFYINVLEANDQGGNIFNYRLGVRRVK